MYPSEIFGDLILETQFAKLFSETSLKQVFKFDKDRHERYGEVEI
jgi:hypothetical protein